MRARPDILARVTFSPGFRRLLPFILLFFTLNGVRLVLESFQAQALYRKDFIVDYLMAKAILAGVNPYLPIPDLIERWMGVNDSAFLHANPHPPIVALLSLPLGLLSYRSAALTWLAFELACLAGSVTFLLQWWGARITLRCVSLMLAAALGWMPVVEELWLGQFSALLLVLLLAAWEALRRGEDWKAGAFTGLMLALKFSGGPICLYLLARRRWRAVAAAGGVFAAANLLPLLVLGSQPIREYYLEVGPQVAAIYRLHEENFSAWTIGQRLFQGSGLHVHVQPLWHAPLLADVFTAVVPLTVLVVALAVSLRARTLDTAVGVLTAAGIWLQPVSWTHYLVLASVPLAIASKRIAAAGWPRSTTYVLGAICCTFSLVGSTYVQLARWISSSPVDLLTWTGLLTLIPALGLCGLIYLLCTTEQEA